MFKYTLLASMLTTTAAFAADTTITGTVQSKCSVYTDAQGVYAQPTPDKLTTDPVDGGVMPIVRYDVAQAEYYTARITWPNNFTSSPALNDVVNWTGEVEVHQVTDPLMSGYETDKVEYDNVTEFNLTVAGTVWFKVTSTATYGYNKSLPAGSYTAIVVAECIAN